ncbi:hypothetical protein H4219_005204 [Mycoemilia scoparia]|uniref:Uncharacterized protein n=1 Tax=Mycoemilia scoparia TaxID=417184 RepID=A0A9W8DQ06_9FUNG|nr:hypothetical protein H4219_005204 [Mycoemilia scoparia]
MKVKNTASMLAKRNLLVLAVVLALGIDGKGFLWLGRRDVAPSLNAATLESISNVADAIAYEFADLNRKSRAVNGGARGVVRMGAMPGPIPNPLPREIAEGKALVNELAPNGQLNIDHVHKLVLIYVDKMKATIDARMKDLISEEVLAHVDENGYPDTDEKIKDLITYIKGLIQRCSEHETCQIKSTTSAEESSTTTESSSSSEETSTCDIPESLWGDATECPTSVPSSSSEETSTCDIPESLWGDATECPTSVPSSSSEETSTCDIPESLWGDATECPTSVPSSSSEETSTCDIPESLWGDATECPTSVPSSSSEETSTCDIPESLWGDATECPTSVPSSSSEEITATSSIPPTVSSSEESSTCDIPESLWGDATECPTSVPSSTPEISTPTSSETPSSTSSEVQSETPLPEVPFGLDLGQVDEIINIYIGELNVNLEESDRTYINAQVFEYLAKNGYPENDAQIKELAKLIKQLIEDCLRPLIMASVKSMYPTLGVN